MSLCEIGTPTGQYRRRVGVDHVAWVAGRRLHGILCIRQARHRTSEVHRTSGVLVGHIVRHRNGSHVGVEKTDEPTYRGLITQIAGDRYIPEIRVA